MADYAPDPDNLLYSASAYPDDGTLGPPRIMSGAILGRDEAGGPEQLFLILESTATNDTPGTTPEEIQKRREAVDHTWDQVRRWFRTHGNERVQTEAACTRGQSELTPLHLMCKLGYPPADLIRAVLMAANEVASWVDVHGWLPLHYACGYGVTSEVLQILINAYPESTLVQDKQNRTPLHFYVSRKVDNPTVMANDVALLCENGAAALPEVRGMLPMHYACAYGSHPPVLKVLKDAYPEGITARENKGRTPMHLAMSNAQGEASPAGLSFLLENHAAFNLRDDEGNTPLHMLTLGLKSSKGVNLDDPEKMQNVAECLKLYLESSPESSPDFLASLQALPDWLQEVAVVSPHVRDILNEKIAQRFPTSILMLDGYILAVIIVTFEIATTYHIDRRYDFKDAFDDIDESTASRALLLLFVGAGYFLMRELIQVVALWSLGSLSSWFYDTTNWLDMTVIILTFYYSVVMSSEDEGYIGMSKEAFRTGCAFTKGVMWMAVIFFLESTQVDFAVFLGGVFYVVQRLVAFLLAVGVILLAFAQMFYIVYLQDPICKTFNSTNPAFDSLDPDDCRFPHCEFDKSLLKVYSMMMGEIGSETRYDGNIVAQLLYVAYAVLVVILLSNVLIAIVTDSYEIIQNDRAAIVFWSNRLDFVAEMDGIINVVRQRVFCIRGKAKGAPGAPTRVQEVPNGTMVLDGNAAGDTSNDIFRAVWKSIMGLFESHFYDELETSPGHLLFWVTSVYRGLALFVIIPVWILLGFVTAGILWPPQVREYLFVQKETTVSRAEIERAKLEQLREIQGDIKTLKSDIRKEMASDRDEMMRMKANVEAIQSEVLEDLQQVTDLMKTILNMGGAADDR